MFSLNGIAPSLMGKSPISNLPFPILSKHLQFSNPTTPKRSKIQCCANSTSSISPIDKDSNTTTTTTTTLPLIKKRKRYRKECPGESKGITEEMRFVAMRLRNFKGKYISSNSNNENPGSESDNEEEKEEEEVVGTSNDADEDSEGGSWEPSMDGFVKYLVDSKLVFNTIEQIVDNSDDVAYAYFRKTGLERGEGLSKDLEWFSQQDIVIPEPCSPGVSYAKYLEELAEKSAPLFLCHFYNIYFSHIAGGQVIARQVSGKILEGRELEFYRWEGDVEELLKGVREKLNMLGEHWSRDEKNRCLREAKKSFKSMGQIVRLIIL